MTGDQLTTTPPADLDVVVLGGGGHVGLPLSLVFARAGLRVGIYDTNQATLDRIAGGEMPFLENGADELLREVLATGRLHFSQVASFLANQRPSDRGTDGNQTQLQIGFIVANDLVGHFLS